MAEKSAASAHQESITTAGEDGLPLEMSAADSVAVTTENDPYDLGMNQDSLASVGEEGPIEGRAGAQALATARAHLAAVAEELATMQSQFGSAPESSGTGGSPDVDGAGGDDGEPIDAALERCLQAKQELERDKRHLEVDLECANTRADRLAQEKEELLAAQARMEAVLRTTRKSLEEARLRLQHRDMDISKAGAEADAFSPPPAPLKEVAEQAGLAPRPAIALSKQQAVAALRAAQAELREERKRRERLERRVQKDKERLERLVAVAETQQAEIRTLQSRCWQSEASAHECLGRLRESVAHGSALQMAIQGARPGSRDSNELATSSFGGRACNAGGVAPSMLRQQSAPTRLPKVGSCN